MLSEPLRTRIDQQLELVAKGREAWGPAHLPWLGHMRVETGGRVLDVLLGSASRTSGGLTVIHWQTAPLSEVFFSTDEGDEYEVELEERTVTGRLLERNALEFERGELIRITTPSTILERAGSEWLARPVPFKLRPRDPGARAKASSALAPQLDPAQRRVVELPAGRNVLLLGEAGFGKTTVALHRLARLRREVGKGLRSAVIVPTDGLRRLTEVLLSRMGVHGVEVWQYEKWAAKQARRAFRGIPKRESVTTGTGALAIKRHPALREVLRQYERRRRGSTPVARGDLEHVFGDRAWMERVAALAPEAVLPRMVKEVVEHTRIQFSDTSEQTYAHFRRDSLETSDGRRIDEGTPMEDAQSIDVEDYAVLFELDRLRASSRGARPATLPRYDCLVVDEAQELAPLELSLIGRSLSPRGSLIVAGDAAQQVDPTASFRGWEQTLKDLGCTDYERAVLEVNYRCPPDVTELARAVLTTEPGPPLPVQNVVTAELAHEFHVVAWLTEELRALESEDPTASIAIVCRTREAAVSMARDVGRGRAVHLALDGDFDFRAGTTVTCVAEVKGLEFDHVILPDASASAYPELPDARRALYVGVTRASAQLALGTSSRWSPLLPPLHPALDALLLPPFLRASPSAEPSRGG